MRYLIYGVVICMFALVTGCVDSDGPPNSDTEKTDDGKTGAGPLVSPKDTALVLDKTEDENHKSQDQDEPITKIIDADTDTETIKQIDDIDQRVTLQDSDSEQSKPIDADTDTGMNTQVDSSDAPDDPNDTDTQIAKEPVDGGDAADDDVDLGISKEPVTLLVIFDKSGSMGAYWNENTKWDAASNALKQAVESAVDRVTVGAILFPVGEECTVEEITGDHQIYFIPGPEFITAWASAAKGNGPTGGTPLAQAFEVADRAIGLAEQEGLLNQPLKVFVLTDGEPNCDGVEENLIDYPSQWLEQGIETYVFGLPGSSSATDILDSIAEAGGTGIHLTSEPGDTPDDLRDEVTACI